MPVRELLRFINGPGAVQHQNSATAALVVRGLHIFVARVRGWVVNLPNVDGLALFVFGYYSLAQQADLKQFLAHFTVAFAVEQ